ncbi:MAG: hypothetical protein AB8G17_04935 [Gammaproteobacteria bacterium]
MEAIAIIIGELIFAALAPLVMVIIDAVGVVVGIIWSTISGRRRSENQGATGGTARTVSVVALGLAVLIFLTIFIVNQFFFSDAVRRVLTTVENRSGISTACRDIDGSLFFGKIDLRDCSIRRSTHDASTFDLTVTHLFVDVSLLSLIGTTDIESVNVAGVNGWATRHRPASSEPESDEHKIKPRRAFDIEQLDVSDINLTITGTNPDDNPFEIQIVVDELHSSPLRSGLALFDILFRSNARGSIAGAPFDISTQRLPEGRTTAWRAQNVPVASLGALTGGPLSWFSDGVVDVNVDDQWQRDGALDIALKWQLNFHDVAVNPPPGSGAFTRLASKPVTAYINRLDGEFPLAFEMVINEDQFEYASSAAAAGLWSAVGDAAKGVLEKIGVSNEEATETGKTLKEGAKALFDRLRKPKEDTTD